MLTQIGTGLWIQYYQWSGKAARQLGTDLVIMGRDVLMATMGGGEKFITAEKPWASMQGRRGRGPSSEEKMTTACPIFVILYKIYVNLRDIHSSFARQLTLSDPL